MSGATEKPPMSKTAAETRTPKIRYCRNCLMPDSRPRISFDAEGICNACRNAEAKATIDWPARRLGFLDYIERYRAKDAPYDCIVPWSGGKDSSYIAWRLKFEFGLNPLLVTFSPSSRTKSQFITAKRCLSSALTIS